MFRKKNKVIPSVYKHEYKYGDKVRAIVIYSNDGETSCDYRDRVVEELIILKPVDNGYYASKFDENFALFVAEENILCGLGDRYNE